MGDRWRGLVALGLSGSIGCSPPPPPRHDAGRPRARVEASVPVRAPDAAASPPRASHDEGALARPRVTAVAGLDAARLLAVADGALYAAQGGRWRAVALGGAEVRDVTAARGELYALARGVGAQSGWMMVLRWRGDELGLVSSVARPSGFEPRRMAMARGEQDLFVGGDGAPWVVRVRWGREVSALAGAAGDVRAMRFTGDEVLLVRSDAGLRAMRWGEWNPLANDVVTLMAGAATTAAVMRDGALRQGLPWVRGGERETEGPAGIEPLDAVQGGGRTVEVSAEGRAVVWAAGGWRALPGVPGGRVLALLGGGDVVAVTADGAAVALRENVWVPCVTAMDAGGGAVR